MEKYAIVETGSKQYWVAPQQVIEVELLDVAEGQKEVILDQVMLVQDGGQAVSYTHLTLPTNREV